MDNEDEANLHLGISAAKQISATLKKNKMKQRIERLILFEPSIIQLLNISPSKEISFTNL